MSVLIPLSRGLFAIVDEADGDGVRRFNWFAQISNSSFANAYAFRTDSSGERATSKMMHREISGAGQNDIVDHINGNGLDNRRQNLRLCTTSQNLANRALTHSATGLRGVFATPEGRFRAYISVNGRRLNLGRFDTPEEAAVVFDDAARKHFGEFASFNFPREGERQVVSSRTPRQEAQ